MTLKRSLNPKDIIRLLGKLKQETPEYPAELLDARKAALLKHAATLKIQGKGHGGQSSGNEGSSGTGGSGPAAGGGPAASGILLQAVVGASLIAALLLTAFAFREKISKILNDDNEVAAGEIVGETLTPLANATPTAVPSATPFVFPSPTMVVPTGAVNDPANIILNGTPLGGSTLPAGGTPLVPVGTPEGTKPNPGLHLGQTPGAPAAPGQGNPGNINQPEKPEKPKPEKPDNPNKPDKPKAPSKK